MIRTGVDTHAANGHPEEAPQNTIAMAPTLAATSSAELLLAQSCNNSSPAKGGYPFAARSAYWATKENKKENHNFRIVPAIGKDA